MPENVWIGVVLVGAAGIGMGMGLVLGAFVARMLRRYMRDEGLGEEHPPKR